MQPDPAPPASAPLPDFRSAVFDASPNAYLLLAPDLTIIGMNTAYLKVVMRAEADLVGRTMFEAFPAPAQNESELRASFERVIERERADQLPLIRYDIPLPDGAGYEERYWSATHTPLFDADGRLAMILQHTVDVTEMHRLRIAARSVRETPRSMEGEVLRRAEAAQRRSDWLDAELRRLIALFEQAPGFIAILSGPDHVFEFVNGAYSELIGHREVLDLPLADALPEISGQGFVGLLDQVYRSGEPFVGRALRALLRSHAGGDAERYIDLVYQPIHGPDGTVTGIFVQGNDVTAEKHARDELREHKEELERLVEERTSALQAREDELRQAQKMEAMGQLTGGFAHDINNLLAVMIGNLDMLRRRLGDAGLIRLVDNALTAGQRSALLTGQLLAFARKQALTIEAVDLQAALAEIDGLLRQTLGPRVSLTVNLPDDLPPVATDKNQFGVAVLNLVVNARDAMPDGGTLTLSAAPAIGVLPNELEPGDYVRVSVADTGSGMPADIVAKAFEPFFTTKELGKGTGLGLSQVYGFARQQGGTATIDSEPGRGTTVSLYLRQSEARPAIRAARAASESTTLLLVEDDDAVREIVADGLRDAGFEVIEAPDGHDGLARLESAPVALALVDFSMPRMDGVTFAIAARAMRPDLPIMLMTGYADSSRLEERPPDIPVIRKPATLTEIAGRVRRMLAGDPERMIAG